MATKPFEIRFTGGDISPQALDLRDMAQLLNVIGEIIRQSARIERNGSSDDLRVSLGNVREGSLGLLLLLSTSAASAYLAYAKGIHAKDLRQFPIGVYDKTRELQDFSKYHGCSTVFSDQNADSEPIAILTFDAEIACETMIQGTSDITGKIIRVGGSKPHVRIRTLDGDTIECLATKQIAKDLAQRLYKSVIVHGQATWVGSTLELRQFRIKDFTEFEHQSLVTSFSELREKYGSEFDGIEDPDAFVSNLRGY